MVGVVSLCLVHYAESMVLLDLSSARRKQREDPVTPKQMAGLRGLIGQLIWLATQVVPQLQALLSLLLAYLGVGSKQTCKTGIVWAQTPLRTFVHEEVSVIGWSDASVGHVDEKDRLKEDTSLEWPTRYQCGQLAQWQTGQVGKDFQSAGSG